MFKNYLLLRLLVLKDLVFFFFWRRWKIIIIVGLLNFPILESDQED